MPLTNRDGFLPVCHSGPLSHQLTGSAVSSRPRSRLSCKCAHKTKHMHPRNNTSLRRVSCSKKTHTCIKWTLSGLYMCHSIFAGARNTLMSSHLNDNLTGREERTAFVVQNHQVAAMCPFKQRLGFKGLAQYDEPGLPSYVWKEYCQIRAPWVRVHICSVRAHEATSPSEVLTVME